MYQEKNLILKSFQNMYIKIWHMKTRGSDTTVRIQNLVHAYVFQKFYFLNTIVENKIKILLI